MKQFVKALAETGDCFRYVCREILNLSKTETKETIFVKPHTRKLTAKEPVLRTITDVN